MQASTAIFPTMSRLFTEDSSMESIDIRVRMPVSMFRKGFLKGDGWRGSGEMAYTANSDKVEERTNDAKHGPDHRRDSLRSSDRHHRPAPQRRKEKYRRRILGASPDATSPFVVGGLCGRRRSAWA